MNNKLILRSTASPFVGQFSDINKGSVLSHNDVDENFIYLKGNIIYTGETIGGNIIFTKINGENIQIPKSEGNRIFIGQDDELNILQYHQYLVYGNLTLNNGVINNDGEIVLQNGQFVISGGTYSSNGGVLTLVSVDTSPNNINKFILTTGLTANVPFVINHGLETTNVITNILDLNTGQKIYVNEFNYNSNDVTIESSETLSNVKITIIG